MADYLSLDILTPEGRVDLRLSNDGKSSSGDKGPIEVEGVEVPAALGEMGVRPRHVPFLTPVVPGVVRFRYDGVDRRMAVGAGFLEISETGVVTLLTERALRSWEVDVADVHKRLDLLTNEMHGHLHTATDDPEVLKLEARRKWLDAQLRAAQG